MAAMPGSARTMALKAALVLLFAILSVFAAKDSSAAFANLLHTCSGQPRAGRKTTEAVCPQNRRRMNLCLLRASSDDNRAEGEGKSGGSGPSPEDWRQFRANLIASEKEKQGAEAVKRSVAKKNEELLRSQNPELAEEYLNGAWAHVTGRPEVGGLLARLPIEAQLVHLMREDALSEWGGRLSSRLEEEIKLGEGDAASKEQLEQRRKAWGSNTAFMFKLSKALITDTISELAAQSGGQIVLQRLKPAERELVEMYAKYQDAWQEVLLVLHDSSNGRQAVAVAINRPLRVGVDASIASIFLHGRDAGQDALDSELLLRFVLAFGRDAVVYLGGPNRVDQPGRMVHGFEELEGAREIAAGTGIYEGGIEAATKGVLEGRYQPLDFRFFLGCREWEEGGLDRSVRDGAYRSIACARPVALKQCLALPKPLWHEVMELCGGESQELSRIEILQRPDIEE